ncbi:unnamed protein product [Vitrella brassicaformis CCMP3155]|uniref:Protein kinase domain-containing protein n=1 Tax=Vitrella brassicaformis (strain CCMP3155) TaxID=1169540 RepID=A0A0G4ERU0_VITBC|nr:unnamed protein product [Vitrella brassicaformis CCMP3155]|eukprot:CEM00612.1 unnamed protein product [Vitrella brassicaformis CCMP3155]
MMKRFGHAIGLPTDVDGGSGGRKKKGLKERGDQVMTEGQLPLGEPPEASEGRPPSRTPPSAPRPSVRFGSDSPQSSQPLPTPQQPLSPYGRRLGVNLTPTPTLVPHSSPSASHESSTTGEQLESPTVNQSLPLEPVGRSHAKSARTEEQVLSEWKKMKERLFENVPQLKTAGKAVSSKDFMDCEGMNVLLAGTVFRYDSREASSAPKSLLTAPLTLTEEKGLEDVAREGDLIFKKIDRGNTQSSVPEVVVHAWLSQHARKEVSRLAPKLYGIVSTEGTEGMDHWSVSECISGGSLKLDDPKLPDMSLAEKANFCLQLLRHVEELHSLGIAHGDLSLANLLLRRQGHGYELFLNDFETAVAGLDKKGKEKRLETYLTRGKGGTPQFMAPEKNLMSSFARASREEDDTGDGGNQDGSKDLVW